MFDWLLRLANAALGKVSGKEGRADTATRMWLDARARGDFDGPQTIETERRAPEPYQPIDPMEELKRILGEG